MAPWDLGSLARAAEADIRGGGLPAVIEAVGTDSRSLRPGSLFVALRGERFDGHDFARAAVDAGARAVMLDREGEASLGDLAVPRLVVPDTLRALGEIASHVRRQMSRPVVAVTGSNGKTTTKELCAAVLGERGAVHKNRANLNNLIGVPLTLLDWPPDAWAAVVEMGMNAPGEIARLAEIAAPDVGLVTNVGPAHLEGLGSMEAVARAKGELYAALAPSATAVVNADDPLVTAIALPLNKGRRTVRFGRDRSADVRVVSHTAEATGTRVRLEIAGAPVDVLVPLVGGHNAMNAAAAAAVGLALGMEARSIAAGLAQVSVPAGRMRIVREVAPGIVLVDDTYNANPASMRAAFAALAELGHSRRVAVLGGMLELGPTSAALHREVGAAAGRSGIGWVLALGEHADELAKGASETGAEATAYGSLDLLCDDLEAGLRPGDTVLVKGSRGMRMERVVERLAARRAGGRS